MTALALAAVAVGGSAGAFARWALWVWWLRDRRHDFRSFPWPTFIANMLGCFLLGLFVSVLGTAVDAARASLYALLATGFCGGLSILSGFALEVMSLARSGAFVTALGYLMLSAGGGMAALWIGLVLAG
ncbi:fluoride efflux transporter FluC [Brachybacterium huguangmaarense]